MATSARISPSGRRQAKAYELFLGLHIRHVDNEFYGVPFFLEGWQREHIWQPLLGCGRMEKGRFIRHFRRGLIGIPRDGGKSDIAAGLLLTIANMEPVHNGEYGIIASSKKQSDKTFGKIKAMVLQDPDLSAAWEVLTNVIRHRETGALIMVFPFSEALAQGYHFNVCIIEELHVHKSTAILDAVISGQKAITNALTLVITTAGPRREGPLWDTIARWRADPKAYVYWLGAEDHEDIRDRDVWRRVTPMSWITMADLEDQFASTSRRSFERYTLNRFPLTGDASKALTPRQIARCVRRPSEFDFEQPFVLGIDGAQSGDAFALIAAQIHDDGPHFREWVFDTPPEDTGFYDLVQIEQLIADIHAKHHPLIVIDPARLLLMAQHLEQSYGVPLVALPQTNAAMCPATSLMQNAVRGGHAHLGGCPKLAEHLGNAVLLDRGQFGERYGSEGKGASKQRIDAAVAGAIALYALETQDIAPSFAETGGVYTIQL